MSSSTPLAFSRYAWDWQPGGNFDRRFSLILLSVLALAALAAYVLSTLVVPPSPRTSAPVVAPRIVNFMANKPKPPPPPTPPKPQAPRPIKPVTAPAAPAEPVAAPQPVAEAPAPAASLGRQRRAQEPLTQAQSSARQKAQSAGLLALGGEVSAVLDAAPSAPQLAQAAATQATQATQSTQATDAVPSTTRDVQLASAPAQRSSTELDTQALKSQAKQSKSEALQAATGGGSGTGSGRSDRDIAKVFVQNQPSLNSLYERARRQLPGLRGKLVLELSISADGSVQSVKVLSSELNSPELEAKILARVKQFKFSPAGKAQNNLRYAMDFLPG